MCKVLKICRSLVYYRPKEKIADTDFENAVIKAFYVNKQVYGAKKISMYLRQLKIPVIASARRVKKVMRKYNLVSKYNLKRRNKKSAVNEAEISNKLDRKFDSRKKLEAIVSDLTYVKVGKAWCYICVIVDVHSRRIIGQAAGPKKDSKLVSKALSSIKADLRNVVIFHTDRGKEFDNELINEALFAFGIERSLSRKGTPIDNAVCESVYSVIKTEMIYGETFETLEQLELHLFDYVNWYNNHRLHGSLGFMTPVQFEASPNAVLKVRKRKKEFWHKPNSRIA